MKQISYMLLMIGFFLLMLLFPNQTFDGATSGLLLWFQIILPTLLPFLIVSNLLIHTNCVYYISRFLNPIIQRIFRVSEQASYAILIGFLCGYPMGAKVIADLIITKRISKEEGQYLLSFCNNTSPMFIISYIVSQNFKDPSLLFGTMLILLLSPIVCSFLFRRFFHVQPTAKPSATDRQSTIYIDFQIFDTSIMNGFETLTKVGGYIILFSVLFKLGSALPVKWLLPTLEISNGIPYIIHLGLPFTATFIYVLSLTSFGSFCAAAQTYSMIQGTGLAIFPYIKQKLITALVTSLFALIYILLILR